MNNKGFTLIEVLSVIVLLGLLVGIAVPNVMRGNKKAKERTLLSKIENIEKAAVLYGQDNREKINIQGNGYSLYPLCYKDNGSTQIQNCYYYWNDNNTPNDTSDDITTITVKDLATAVQGYDEDGNPLKGYIQYDKDDLIVNPTDESKNMNDCEIQIYQKYGKIYAVYDKELESSGNMKCWVD